jgi:hypothetical protein
LGGSVLTTYKKKELFLRDIMKIEFKTTDEDGIETFASFDSDFEHEEDFRDLLVLIFKLLIKNKVDVPEEIVEELEKI